MKLITEAQVSALLTPAAAAQCLREAFTQMGHGRASVMARGRAAGELDGATLMISAMGATLPAAGVLGTKVYSTRNGQFQFVVTLFSAETGLPLATLEANELTRQRTAAATAVAVDALARQDAKVLAIFGAGTQARAHLEAIRPLRAFDRVLVCARSGAAEFAAQIGGEAVDAATAAAQGDVIIAATRSSEALFDGALIKPGAFVGAVGSSKPAARELDDALLSRAALIAVEWKTAAETEAGEFKRAAAGVIRPERVVELGALLAAPRAFQPEDVIVYKSVGIGLEDVAIANWIYQQVQQQQQPQQQGGLK